MIERFLKSRTFKIMLLAAAAFAAIVMIANATVYMLGSRSPVHTKHELYEIVNNNSARLESYTNLIERNSAVEAIVPNTHRYDPDKYVKISDKVYARFDTEPSEEDIFSIENMNTSFLFDEIGFERIAVEGECVFFVDNTKRNETTAVVHADMEKKIPETIAALEVSRIKKDWYYIVYKKIA